VVDANAIIGGASHLLGAADRFFTIRQVLEEVRDPISRLQMASVPLTLECVEPEKEAITKGVKFNCYSCFLSSCLRSFFGFFWC
jgi:RNA-binding protein NOB1